MNIPLRRYWRLLAQYLQPQRRRALVLALLILMNIGLGLLNPQIMRSFIDGALAGAAQDVLTRSALIFLAVAILSQVLTVYTNYLSGLVGWTATNALRFDLATHCLKLDLSFHKGHTPGELIERIDGDVQKLANFFTLFTINLLGNLILMVGVLVLLFREEWRVGLGMTLFAVIATIVLVRIRGVATPFWAQVRQTEATFYGFLGEQLTSTEDIRANGAQGYVMRRFYALLRNWQPLQSKAGLAGYLLWNTSALTFALGNMLAFGLGAYLWRRDLLTIGAVYLIFRYTELIRQPINQIRNQLTDLQEADASIQRVEQLFATSSQLAPGRGAVLPHGPLAVDFQQVAFHYEDQEPVLQTLTFHLQAGRVLGLLGRTGSGKSTLARLLVRFYDPVAGEVRLSGVRSADVQLRELRRRVGLVTQDVQLFQATVRENLTFFDSTIDDAQIMGALAELGLDGWLRALPKGLETILGAGGAGLSAGQAQLLAFARIFLSDPGLVILDEASSRVDPATEQMIERAVSKLLHNRTAILIAHRLTTVQRADEILILEKGQILEYGERAQLVNDPGSHFYKLLQTGMEEVLA